MQYAHYTQHTTYNDFLTPLCDLSLTNAVLDRCAICEIPYHTVMNRNMRFNTKQLHNLILLTLIQKPLVILCTYKPPQLKYGEDQYMPYIKWDECMHLYEEFLTFHDIPHLRYDYSNPSITISRIIDIDISNQKSMAWWRIMHKHGYGCIGSPSPETLIIGERLGPNNIHLLPFETGPTGNMMSKMIMMTETPLSSIAITNYIKAELKSTRMPNESDVKLLFVEINMLRPRKIILMGKVAAKAKNMIIDRIDGYIPTLYDMTHLGFFNRQGNKVPAKLHAEWYRIMHDII